MPFADWLDLGRSAEVWLARVGTDRIPDRSVATVVGADLADAHRRLVVVAESSGVLRDLRATLVDLSLRFGFAGAEATRRASR